MLLIYGTRRTERNVGFVADFCPICRQPSAFKLRRIGSVSHLYGVSLGAGKLVGFTRICLRCQIETWTNRDNYPALCPQFTAAEIQSSVRMSQLMTQTMPSLHTHYAERLALETEIRRNPLTLDALQRRSLLKDPVFALGHGFDKHFEGTVLDAACGLTLLVGILLSMAAAMLTGQLLADDELGMLIVLGVATLSLLAVAVQVFRVKGRYIRNRIYPLLAATLKPLQPTAREIDSAFAELRQVDLPLAKLIRTPALIARLIVVPKKTAGVIS